MSVNNWKEEEDGRSEPVQMTIPGSFFFHFVPVQKFNVHTGQKNLQFSKYQRLCPERLLRAIAAWKTTSTQPRTDSPSNWEVIWMIRTRLISLFHKTVLGIILLVFRRLNQQFDELGALLALKANCFSGSQLLRVHIKHWWFWGRKDLQQGQGMRRALNRLGKKKKEIVKSSVRLDYEGSDKWYFWKGNTFFETRTWFRTSCASSAYPTALASTVS